MKERYPDNPKEQYSYLVERAERYARKPRISQVTLRSWQNRAVDWLKDNAPNTGLASDLVVVPPNNIRRGLSVLLKARRYVSATVNNPERTRKKPNTRNVFIVHGHDESLKNAVKQFLLKIGLRPIILHEQANKGRKVYRSLRCGVRGGPSDSRRQGRLCS